MDDQNPTLEAALLQKAQAIGPPKVGATLEPEGPVEKIMSLLTGTRPRPSSVVAQDPYGTEAFLKGKGPLPVMMGGIDDISKPTQGAIKAFLEKIEQGVGSRPSMNIVTPTQPITNPDPFIKRAPEAAAKTLAEYLENWTPQENPVEQALKNMGGKARGVYVPPGPKVVLPEGFGLKGEPNGTRAFFHEGGRPLHISEMRRNQAVTRGQMTREARNLENLRSQAEIPRGTSPEELADAAAISANRQVPVERKLTAREQAAKDWVGKDGAPKGVKQKGGILNQTSVKEMRELAAAGASPDQLAAKYGVSKLTVSQALKRESWAWVK